MTTKAPTHGNGLCLGNPLHRGYVPVAVLATKVGRDVHPVGEVDKFGHGIHPLPGDRLPAIVVGHEPLNLWAIGPDYAVATYADLFAGDARDVRFGDSRVAEHARNRPIPCVLFVTESYGLYGPSRPDQTRAIEGDKGDSYQDQQKSDDYSSHVLPSGKDSFTTMPPEHQWSAKGPSR